MRTIAIVGGGFSGTVLAAQLLRQPPAAATRIVLVERRAEIGRGVAYAARDRQYLLNVPAGRMSALQSEPNQFVDFARLGDPSVSASGFLPRATYGRYLQHLLLRSALTAPHGVQIETVRTSALGVSRSTRSQALNVRLADGGVVSADDVVLACGNPSPTDVPGAAAVADHPRYVRDPCCDRTRPALRGSVLLVGTGLTMADTAVAAARDPTVVVHAISRHGLLPLAQSSTENAEPGPEVEKELLASVSSLRALLRATRKLCADDCVDWRDAVNAVRRVAPSLWHRLADGERRRFLRHLRSYWDAHRHRLPPRTAERLAGLRAERRLSVHAGRIRELQAHGDGIRVLWQARGETSTRAWSVDWVVNCTGPDYDLRRSADPLLKKALTTGLAVADSCGLGLRTGPHGTVIDAAGTPAEHLFYLGPMLRAAHWEATSVPELRGHAKRLAQHLAKRPANGAIH